ITVIRYPLADSAGMLVRTATDAWIVVSTMDPETRQRFTVAHELGHYFYDTVHANDTRLWVEEMEANAFAAALLVPPDDLRRLAHPRTLSRWAVDDHDNGRVQRLAARYGVSVAVVVQSLVDAGMVRGVQPWTPPSIVWTNWTRLTAAVAATATGSPWESWAVTSNGSAAHV
ncbi:MAG: ImmA/IrrE family metallo-endopeptidase, partial [Firmicutes bacterium]|nr:ImmA/IrrE family metallo-endopeptidase [Bacillota bacterium]